MAKAKSMNEVKFAKIVKELDSFGELIKTKQNEKQSVMDDFEREKARLKSGKISEATLASSANKVNKELQRLDKDIKDTIVKVGKIAAQSKEFASMQKPKPFRARVSGIGLPGASKPKPTKKKSVKDLHKKEGIKPSKTVLQKEKTLDRKFVKKA